MVILPMEQPPTFLYSNVLTEMVYAGNEVGSYYRSPKEKSVKDRITANYANLTPAPRDLPLTLRIAAAEPKVSFQELVARWKHETEDYSVIAKRYRHPSYKAILELRGKAVPSILNEMRREPDHWFAALEQLTGKNPAKQAKTFYEAVDLWIAWGISEDLIS